MIVSALGEQFPFFQTFLSLLHAFQICLRHLGGKGSYLSLTETSISKALREKAPLGPVSLSQLFVKRAYQ